jgi:hypothetical protein
MQILLKIRQKNATIAYSGKSKKQKFIENKQKNLRLAAIGDEKICILIYVLQMMCLTSNFP